MTRREIRETSFRILFSLDFCGAKDLKNQLDLYHKEHVDLAIDSITDTEDAPVYVDDESWPDVCSKCVGTAEHLKEIDAAINDASDGWKTSRMTKVDLTLLRLAVYEMHYEDLPKGVAINEAVELAKKYGTSKSSAFVNGVLAKIS